MRKLKQVRYAHSRRLTDEEKDMFIIPNKFDGSVAIETWEVNGQLRDKAVCVASITSYLLGLGEFKETGEDSKKEYLDEQFANCNLNETEDKI